MRVIQYCIQALAGNQVAVLKSVILLAEKQTGCSWVLSKDPRAKVLFIGPDAGNYEHHARPGQILVSLGAAQGKQFYHLDFPLTLAGASKLLTSVAQACSNEPKSGFNKSTFSNSTLLPSVWDFGLASFAAHGSASGKPVAAPAPAPIAAAPASSGKRYHLKHWPPAGIIGNNRSYVRAAAVLAANKPLTSDELAKKTQIPLQECREFLGKLGDAKCLQVSSEFEGDALPSVL